MKEYKVGLVGVGAVGTEMIKVLKERKFPMKGQVQVFASRERDEKILGETYHVLPATETCFNGLDIVLFAGKTDVAIQLKDACVKAEESRRLYNEWLERLKAETYIKVF